MHHFNGWVRAHETSLTLTLFIEVPVPSQESEWSVFVFGVSILPLYGFDIHVFDFGNVAKVQYFYQYNSIGYEQLCKQEQI